MPVLVLALFAAFATQAAAQSPNAAEIARADHALNRLAFGPRPGEVERVAGMGVDRWIAEQLRPAATLDAAAATALTGCPVWTQPATAQVSVFNMIAMSAPAPAMSMAGGVARTVVRADSATLVSLKRQMTDSTNLLGSVRLGLLGASSIDSLRRAGPLSRPLTDINQFYGCRLARAEASDQQLVEVMTDFWGNHFSVHHSRTVGRHSYIGWERDVIRARALGRFRDLLGAVARHPVMLDYLDNSVSTASRLNENYGRELLELHTLGVDGGYSQADVIDVARAFTGWTHTGPLVGTLEIRRRPAQSLTVEFEFVNDDHDTGPKTVLGHALAAGRGIEDGEQVLDILARHPSTARFIARKLAVRLVSDNPPPALVERAAATYLRTDGDIAEVVRSIVTSAEFVAPEAHRAKLKSPLELVLSMRRALGAPEDVTAEAVGLLVELNQPPLGHPAPDGWPETAAGWLGSGAVMSRVTLASRVAAGDVASIPLDRWPEWDRLRALPFDAQVDGVIQALFAGQVSPTTRAAMLRARPGAPILTEVERGIVLRDLVGLALASPDFQRR